MGGWVSRSSDDDMLGFLLSLIINKYGLDGTHWCRRDMVSLVCFPSVRPNKM